MPATQGGGGYRLPRTIDVRLAADVEGLRNAEAVRALALFLGRYHSSPTTLGRAFPVDRVALAAHGDLDLSEARVRGALAVLERVGFLERIEAPGSAYRATEHGLRRRPVLWRIGAAFAVLFQKANTAALAARGAGSTARRPVTSPAAPRPSAGLLAASKTMTAPLLARKESPVGNVSSGEQNPAGSETGLEAALARLRHAIEGRAA